MIDLLFNDNDINRYDIDEVIFQLQKHVTFGTKLRHDKLYLNKTLLLLHLRVGPPNIAGDNILRTYYIMLIYISKGDFEYDSNLSCAVTMCTRPYRPFDVFWIGTPKVLGLSARIIICRENNKSQKFDN